MIDVLFGLVGFAFGFVCAQLGRRAAGQPALNFARGRK